ncbi:MAG: filamentous hemagglutinin N-terminal domain-containing protein, partial [Victivallales bacterium]|nr:filamentous hemagglutinin N-terminal domain-containing protein [Victivallales bacterium]
MKLFSIIMVAILMFSPGGLLAGSLPSGYKVVKGKVTVTTDGKVMDIDQATQKAIVNWQKFGIDEGYTVNVNQINSTAAMLARVIGNDPSNILGNLNATGHFYLVNQNGVYFGPNSRVDVGAIIASTMDILDDDFMAGNLNFFGEAKGSVINAGKINADAVALIGQNVQNTGTINASQVGLIAPQKSVTLSDFGGGSKLVVDFSDFNKATDAAAPTTVVNEGTVNAGNDGDVVLFAEAGEASNENGTIIANTAEISGAKVDLTKLGSVKANDLLIDPDGTLILEHSDTAGTGNTFGDEYLSKMMELVLAASNITLSYDDIQLNDDIDITSTKGLTLKTNNENGTFYTNDNSITTAGDLTIDAGKFEGALTLEANNGSVNIIARGYDDEGNQVVDINTINTLNGAFIDADTVNFDNVENAIVNTTVFNAAEVNINALSADITINGDANDPLGSTDVNVESAQEGITINKVNAGDLAITSESDLLLNGVTAVGDLSVIAGGIDIDGSITAANVDLQAFDNGINVGSAYITAAQDAIFNGAIAGDYLNVKASGIAFKDDVNVTNLTATASNLSVVSTVSADNVLDFSGVNQVILNGEDVTLAGSTLYLNNIKPGASADGTVEVAPDLMIIGNANLNGDIHAQNVYIAGNINLQNDIAILAESGSDVNKVYGVIALGAPETSNVIAGSHDLTLRGSDITIINGIVDVNNLNITAKADPDEYSQVYFTGSTMLAKNDMIINAEGEVIIFNSEDAGNEISAGNNIVIKGSNVTVNGGLNAGNTFTVTADEIATIYASSLDNGVINAATAQLIEKNEGEGLAIGQNGDVTVNAPSFTLTGGTDVTVAFRQDVEATVAAETLVVTDAKTFTLIDATVSDLTINADDIILTKALTVDNLTANADTMTVTANGDIWDYSITANNVLDLSGVDQVILGGNAGTKSFMAQNIYLNDVRQAIDANGNDIRNNLVLNGNVFLGGDIKTNGFNLYRGNVTLTDDVTLSVGSTNNGNRTYGQVSLGGNITGDYDLDIDALRIRTYGNRTISVDNLNAQFHGNTTDDGFLSLNIAKDATLVGAQEFYLQNVSVGNNLTLDATNNITINNLTVGNSFDITAGTTVNLKADALDNGTITAGQSVTLDKTNTGSNIAVGQNGDVLINAPTVTINNGSDVAVSFGADETTANITADNLYVKDGKIVKLTQTVSNNLTANAESIDFMNAIAVNKLDATADNNIHFYQNVEARKNINVTAGKNIEFGNTVTARVSSNVTAKAGNNINFNGAVKVGGNLIATADNRILFSNTVTSGYMINVNSDNRVDFLNTVEASSIDVNADKMYVYNDITALGVIDFSGVDQVLLNGDSTFKGGIIYVNDVTKNVQNPTFTLSSNINTYLNGNIDAGAVAVNGNVTLTNDVSISASDYIYLGNRNESRTVNGSYDLNLTGGNAVRIYDTVNVRNLSAQGNEVGNNYDVSNGITAEGNIILNASGDMRVKGLNAGADLVLNAGNMLYAYDPLIAGNGFDIKARKVNIYSEAIDNGRITADDVVFRERNEGEGIAIGQEGEVVVNAPTVRVRNGSDVALTFGEDTDADIAANTLVVNDAKNLSVTTDAAEVAITNAAGSVDITAKEGTATMAITGANVAGDFVVTSDADVTFTDAVVKAGNGVNLTAANIALEGTLITADTGNVEFTADAVTVAGDNQIVALGDAIFRAPVSGEGTLGVQAANIGFTDSVNIEGNLTAAANSMAVAGYVRANVIDLSAVNQVVLNGEMVEFYGSELYINNVAPGVDANGNEIIATLMLEADDIVALGGDIHAQAVAVFTDAIVLQNDVSIIAESGSDENKIYGEVFLGRPEGDPTYITGTHDLAVRAGDVDIYGLVDVKGLAVTVKASEEGEYPTVGDFYFQGATMAASTDLIIDAEGDIIINNALEAGNEISAGNNLVLKGANVAVEGGIKAGNGFTATATAEDGLVAIKADTLDNGVINAAAVELGKKEDGEGIAIGQNGAVLINADETTITDGTDVAVAFGKDATATIGAENIAITGATNLSL